MRSQPEFTRGQAAAWAEELLRTQWSKQAPQSAQPQATSADAYRIADGIVEVAGDSHALRDRFRQLYAECRHHGPLPEGLPRVRCTVTRIRGSHFSRAEFLDPQPLDAFDFTRTLFHDRGYVESGSSIAGWRFLAREDHMRQPVAGFRGATVFVDERQPWQALVANLATNRLLRLQSGVLFFHAAAVGVRDSGMVLMGGKGLGKTTVSLCLAARGHRFLSDEICAVGMAPHELLPFRRAVSIREGPASEGVCRRLQELKPPREIHPDGSVRLRVTARQLFPLSEPARVPLRCVFLLEGFAAKPRAERLRPQFDLLRRVTPLGCCLYRASPRKLLFQLLRLLTRSRVYSLQIGAPEHTADLLEQIMEEAE